MARGPLFSARLENVRAICHGHMPAPVEKSSTVARYDQQTRAPRRQAYPRFKRIVRAPSTARAHDVRYQIYIPPVGSIAWTLMGARVIR